MAADRRTVGRPESTGRAPTEAPASAPQGSKIASGKHAAALAASRPHFRQNARQAGGFALNRFIFCPRTEKLSGRFRVLVRNRHRLAPPRRDHVVDSTSVWFPIWAEVSQYERGLLPPWW